MRRPTVHRLFATATLVLLTVALYQAFTLWGYKRIVDAVNAVPASLEEVPPEPSADGGRPASPAAQIATASALARGSQFEAAEALLVKLIDEHGSQPLGRAAQFNLANHYLRAAGGSGGESGSSQPTGAALPLLGVAKQRYRDLLLADPDDWDARYNLERALALAPEGSDDPLEDKQVHQRANVVVPDFEQLDLP